MENEHLDGGRLTAASVRSLVEKLGKVGKYQFMAEPFHCDFATRLFVGHLGNHLLNAADFHSNDRGFGMIYLKTIRKAWVLSRLAIELEQVPMAYDKFWVETWVEGAMRYFTNRNFAITAPGGAVYGYGRSVWAMIDTETRQPQNIMEVHDGAISDFVEKEKPCPIAKSSRVQMGDGAQLVRTIETFYNDVDMNGHINSVKYIEHVLDLWDLDWYRNHQIRRFEVAYVAESHQGDRLSFYREQTADNEYCVRICKGDGTEVVRSKVVFT